MPVIIDYILKLNICLAVVYIFYQFLLRRLTFYNWNRWYLLGYTVLSFIIPLIDIMPSLEKRALQENAVMHWIPAIGFTLPAQEGFFEALSTWDWIVGGVLLGSLVLLARFGVRFYSFRKMQAKAELISNDGTKIYQIDAAITPFSFGNSIFINTDMHSGDDLEEIIRHEFVHVKQKHTIDIMWCELLCVLNWFNPLVWLLRHSVKQNLEFIADSKVLQNGFDRKEYQYLLLKVLGNRQFAFTNHFNFSSLKKRIAMMNTIRSTKIQLVKFMFLLPVVAVLLLSFRKEANTRPSAPSQENSAQAPADTPEMVAVTPSSNDTVPRIVLKATNKLADPDARPLIVVDGEEQKPDFDLNTIAAANIESVNVLKDNTAEQAYGKKGRNGVVSITTKGAVASKPVTSVHFRPVESGQEPLYVIDGAPLEKGQLSSIEPNTIKSITVLKDDASKSIYGPKAEHGVVIISTKAQESINFSGKSDTVSFTGKVAKKYTATASGLTPPPKRLQGRVAGVGIASDGNTKNEAVREVVVVGHPTRVRTDLLTDAPADAYYVLNGEHVKHDVIKQLDSKAIHSVDVLKGAQAKKFYGDKAKEGAILITTK